MKTDCAVAMLESHLEPRSEIIFLARETMQVADSGDQSIARLKSSLGDCLQKMFGDTESEDPAAGVPQNPSTDEDDR